MTKPVLVIMAAGMGSRYGGLKQIDPVDKEGNIIIDFSIYDAIEAGFEKVIFIIKKEIEADFKESIHPNITKKIVVEYAFQELDNIPQSFEIPDERVKPWGTAHAIYSAKDLIDGPFAVINADDYYGRDAFKKIYDFLANAEEDDKLPLSMVGYRLYNTVTDNGHVARGICQVSEDGYLLDIVERTKIQKFQDHIAYTEDDGETWHPVDEKSMVSMNMWGYPHKMLAEIEKGFPKFLEKELKRNPLKSEYLLPTLVSDLLDKNKVSVKVLKSEEKWYGVTYKEDKPVVVKAIQEMKASGKYPAKLWED